MSTQEAAVPSPGVSVALSTQEKLLFAQAVYKVGAAAWNVISNLLTSHPLCEMTGRSFTPEQCEAIYIDLMTSTGHNVPAPDAMKPQSKTHLRLAQTFYLARLKELKSEVETYENRFTVLMGEINAIKSGTMDDMIREEVKASLVKKYGKKLLDWLPDEGTVKEAVEAGPIKDGEVDSAREKASGKETVGATEGDASDGDVLMDHSQPKESAEEPTALGKSTVDAAATTEVTEQPSEAKSKRGKKESKAKETKEEVGKAHSDRKSLPKDQETQPEIDDTAATPAGPSEDVTDSAPAPEGTRPSTDKPAPRTSRRKENESAAVAPKTPAAPSPASDLSPPPSTQPEPKQEPTTPAAGPSSPTPAETAPRTSKRKASTQPRGVPASKRSGKGRRATSPTHTHSEAASDHEGDGDAQMADAEADAEPEAPVEEGGRGRRSSKRHTKAHDTPPPPSRNKESSPAVSRRAQSVSSNASTPQATEEKRPRRGKNRGMRDEVVSKSVREQSAAVESVKEEDDEAESPRSPAEESRPSRTSTRRGKKEASPPEDKSLSATPATVRKTRSAKTPTLHELAGDEDEGDATTSIPGGSASEAKVDKNDRGSEKPERGRGGRKSEPKDGRAAQKLLYSLLDTIQSHQHGAVFQNPVKKSDAPSYYDIIKKPMDTKKVRQRIRDGKITNIDQFERDILLMFANAMMYNEEGSQVYEMAMDMLRESENHIAHYRTMQDDLAR